MRDGPGKTVRAFHSFSNVFFVREFKKKLNETRPGGRGSWSCVAHLESLRVFVYLAGRLVVIERVPENQAQIFIDF